MFLILTLCSISTVRFFIDKNLTVGNILLEAGLRSIIGVGMLFFIIFVLFYFHIYFNVLNDITQQLIRYQQWIQLQNNLRNILIII